MYIYKTTCILDGKFYIGQCARKGNTSKYLGSGIHLKRAIRKHGREQFVKEIIESCENKERLDERERHWITVLSPSYNIAAGGEGGNIIDTLPNKKEIIEKQKEGRRRSWKSRKGTYKVGKRSEEHLALLKRPRPAQSAAMKGRKKSDAHKEAMTLAWKRRKNEL